jgi:hypothetical protein
VEKKRLQDAVLGSFGPSLNSGKFSRACVVMAQVSTMAAGNVKCLVGCKQTGRYGTSMAYPARSRVRLEVDDSRKHEMQFEAL